MMNGSGQPPMAAHPGRGQHEMQYNSQHHNPYPQQPYGQHPQHFRPPYYQQPPQQWQYYPGMQPMHRPYPPSYQAMMATPYPMTQMPQSMSPRPSQHIPYHPSPRPPHNLYSSPPPSDRPTHQLPPMPMHSVANSSATAVTRRVPWYPSLPWYSDSSTPFPPAARKRKRRFVPQSPSVPVELPQRHSNVETETDAEPAAEPEQISHQEIIAESASLTESMSKSQDPIDSSLPSQMASPDNQNLSIRVVDGNTDTPATSQAPSENNCTSPSTSQPPRSSGSISAARPTVKLVPVIPVIPRIPGLTKPPRKESSSTVEEVARPIIISDTDIPPAADEHEAITPETLEKDPSTQPEGDSQSPPQRAAPKSWADLVRLKAPTGQQQIAIMQDPNSVSVNGTSGKHSLADLLQKFSIEDASDDHKLVFVKPRGLINTGNMCYMNAVLQVLLFCIPFYDFLENVSKNATHSFKSETPMMDAMILFVREFPVIDAANSAEQLRLRLKNEELEQYGEAFTPEFVYEVIRRLPRFASMRRGHQQDAEEFLGFLLEELHEECVRSIKGTNSVADEIMSPTTVGPQSESGGWHEVGPKQRPAVTRLSGHISAESPITKIFGGNLRSEFRVPGTKNSVTFEPYQPLQLDIGSPQVNNIVDALKGLTRSEVIHGDFNSPRGPGVTATKQVFIETLPPVLILHLKRFQYDNAGGTQKIWKKVGYPLELEIPKEVFPQHKRGGFAVKGGLPKYRLISVVYHHGKSASGGHYTVDVRRQDGLEWIRLDDTIIRRVRSEDVAEGGSEEDPKILAAALEQHKRDQSASSNIFDQVREKEEESVEAERGWSHVNGSNHGSSSKKWSGVVVNGGTATPTQSSGKRTPVNKSSVKDNKVAYLLFYQRIGK